MTIGEGAEADPGIDVAGVDPAAGTGGVLESVSVTTEETVELRIGRIVAGKVTTGRVPTITRASSSRKAL